MCYEQLYMDLGECIKKVREAKGLSQKEVAIACKMDTGNYSRIENGKTDPAFSSVIKIAKALGIELAELFKAEDLFKEVLSANRSLLEKVALIEQLDKKEKQAFYTLLDALIAKKKMRDALTGALHQGD